MVGMGMPVPFVDAMVGMIQQLRGLGRIEPTRDVQTVTGRTPHTFRQWVGGERRRLYGKGPRAMKTC